MTGLRFDDRVVVVTGAGRGVGRSHALLLAAKGARVVVVDSGADIDGSGHSRAPAEAVAEEINASGGQAVACFASVADERAAADIIDTALRQFGRLDAIVNNAGIHDPAPFQDLTVSQFRTMIDVHYVGTALVTRAAWPHFIRAGYGRVVNTVSEAMLGGIPELSSYGAAKGAVFGLTRNLATEGAAHGIAVNAIAPRAFTRMSASHSHALAEHLSIPTDVMDQINAAMPPELCAPAAVFLAHDSCTLTGEVLQIGMGSVARLAVVRGPGFARDALTAEDIADNLADVMNLHDASVTGSAAPVL
ncbi:SDR family NAD(P)-dependent oxidoreductase [Mycobacterium intracellulare]|uniref:SDR family NAD(P)-dependent oxidoreductase n=1 Tax=Mycobacterium intracellulare TaxID=1767 RepID=UPI001E3CF0EC|nr:SDR family NAD(P)-dependent oxidoreductase [Mycobacterium intracellulare]UGT99156.1 SDR family NAD(P)-dependent oxidoreductase [Mycobacterium intracellulare]